MKAIIAIDVQNDFCPGGSLPVPYGDQVVSPINELFAAIDNKDFIKILTRCSHPEKMDPHFTTWPPHCVLKTPGWEFHQDLDISNAVVFSKGTLSDQDAYSGFEGSTPVFDEVMSLDDFLTRFDIDEIFICGLATDYCVKATALDARKLDYTVTVITDACRAVNIKPSDGVLAFEEMIEAKIRLRTSQEILKELKG